MLQDPLTLSLECVSGDRSRQGSKGGACVSGERTPSVASQAPSSSCSHMHQSVVGIDPALALALDEHDGTTRDPSPLSEPQATMRPSAIMQQYFVGGVFTGDNTIFQLLLYTSVPHERDMRDRLGWCVSCCIGAFSSMCQPLILQLYPNHLVPHKGHVSDIDAPYTHPTPPHFDPPLTKKQTPTITVNLPTQSNHPLRHLQFHRQSNSTRHEPDTERY